MITVCLIIDKDCASATSPLAEESFQRHPRQADLPQLSCRKHDSAGWTLAVQANISSGRKSPFAGLVAERNIRTMSKAARPRVGWTCSAARFHSLRIQRLSVGRLTGFFGVGKKEAHRFWFRSGYSQQHVWRASEMGWHPLRQSSTLWRGGSRSR
jgi:hypothetical protein